MRWGKLWGVRARWGAAATLETWEQGALDIDAKQDTRFLSKSNTGVDSELASDRSQRQTDLTVGTSPQLSNTSPGGIWDLGSEWSLEFLINMNTSTVGLLAMFSHPSSVENIIRINGSSKLEIEAGSVVVATVDIDQVLSGTLQDVALGVAIETNGDSTNLFDTANIWVYAQNKVTGVNRVWRFDGRSSGLPHSIRDLTTQRIDLFGDAGVGSETDFSGGTVKVVRFSNAFHTPTELYEDFIGRSMPIARTAKIAEELLFLNVGLHEDEQLAGPVYSAIAADIHQQSMRLVGPVINEVYYGTTYTLDKDSSTPVTPGGSQWIDVKGLTLPTWYIGHPYFVWRPVPNVINKVRVRLQGTFPADLQVACFSFNARPRQQPQIYGKHIPDNVKFTRVSATPGAITGWVDLGYLTITRDSAGGGSYFALAFGSIVAGSHAVTINAWIGDGASILTAGSPFGMTVGV